VEYRQIFCHDRKLNGANPIDVLIEFPKGKSLYDPETLAVIAAVHATVEKQPRIANVWSLETLRRWFAEKMGKSDVATLKQYVDILPQYLTRRFISAEQDAVLVSGRVPDVDASQLLRPSTFEPAARLRSGAAFSLTRASQR
jgi:hypothetical protein